MKDRVADFEAPEDIYARKLIGEGMLDIRVLRGVEDFAILGNNGLQYKFIFTKRNELVVGAIGVPRRFPSHTSIARYANKNFGTSNRVVSAGYLKNNIGVIEVNNRTGHFVAPPDLTVVVKYKIRGFGLVSSNSSILVK